MDNRNTLSVVLAKVEQLLELKYSGSTPKNYLHHINLFLIHSKNVPDRVNNEDILDYNLSIRNLGHSYRNVAINAIKAYFKLYLRKEVKGFASIRPPSRKTLPEVYDYHEVSNKIDNIKNLKHKAVLHIALNVWLRQGEVRNLKIEDISGSKETIFIRQSKGCKDGEIDIKTDTLELLREYYKEYRPKEFLFEGQSKPQYASLNKVCQNYLGFRFHCLRATGANYANLIGWSLFDISNKLRHSHIKTTEYYLRANLKGLAYI